MELYYLVGVKCVHKSEKYNELDLITIDVKSNYVIINFKYFWNEEDSKIIYKSLLDQKLKIINSDKLDIYLNPFNRYNPKSNMVILKKYLETYKKIKN